MMDVISSESSADEKRHKPARFERRINVVFCLKALPLPPPPPLTAITEWDRSALLLVEEKKNVKRVIGDSHLKAQ